MDIRAIKNDRYYFWTNHVKYKMQQYGLSPTTIKKVLRRSERLEEGIAPETTAVMRRKDTKKTQREIWVMYQKPETKTEVSKFSRTKIISAWIYPGVSPKNREIFIPEDVWEALRE